MGVVTESWHRVVHAWNDAVMGRNGKDTWGVKALIVNPHAPSGVLMVRHPYGDQNKWHLPGGGYNPQKETPECAVLREIFEELALRAEIAGRLRDYTIPKRNKDGEVNGAVDTVAPFVCYVGDLSKMRLAGEISQVEFFQISDILAGKIDTYPISRWMVGEYQNQPRRLSPTMCRR